MSSRPIQRFSMFVAVILLAAAAAAQDAKPGIEFHARILDTRCNGDSHEFFMSHDGQFAVSVEPRTEVTARYALWNLTEGRLVRYLAAKEGAGVKAYAGDDDDGDVGVETRFSQRRVQRIIFAPDGGLIAALTQAAAPEQEPQKARDEILVWETSTGELKRRVITNRGHHHHTFFFVDPNHIITKAFSQAGVSSNKTVAALVLPYSHVKLPGLSHDAQRLAIPTDNRQMLILDFPNGPPKGVISVVRAAENAEKEPLR